MGKATRSFAGCPNRRHAGPATGTPLPLLCQRPCVSAPPLPINPPHQGLAAARIAQLPRSYSNNGCSQQSTLVSVYIDSYRLSPPGSPL